ncbi:alpha-glucosidase C-terminal domain-containing protein [Azospirillum thermophilum]|uniref:alpha-glucosidase C-terminal domain-containing protein n=1 Tax=Azospirillum thermophilum TaxID=2202148 RepID=UPI001FEB9772|nr:alpha-glucosidase C-terminal domain-containing protein [Azospirillum thermophilum]
MEEKGDVLAFERMTDGERLLAVFNMADRPAEYALKRKGRPVPLDLPRAPGCAVPDITADGRILVLPPLSGFLGLRGGAS